MHLYVVRHGETWANIEHRYLGSLDPELTERGRQQAYALGDQLPADIDVIVVSPLLRARQTGQILSNQLNLSLQIQDVFRERNVGVFEGLTQAQAKCRYPDLWAQNITRQWSVGPTGGESIAEVVTRVRQGLFELSEAFSGKTVILVAHGFVAKTARALVKKDFSDFFDWQLPNGQVLYLGSVTSLLHIDPSHSPLPVL